jgi:hypothetical protein
MNTQVNDNAIDEIVATCNGDIRGALKALMLVNEQLEPSFNSSMRPLVALRLWNAEQALCTSQDCPTRRLPDCG